MFRASRFLAVLLAGCPAVVDDVPVPSSTDGLSYLAFHQPGRPLELLPFGPDDTLERARDEAVQVFLIVVTESRVREQYPRIDGRSFDRARIDRSTEALLGCESIGHMEETSSGHEVELPLDGLAEVRALSGRSFEATPFPDALAGLSVFLPIAKACPSLEYDMRPFGQTSPAMGIGTVVQSTTITAELRNVFFARGVAYLGLDLAAVANARFVYVLPRGGTIEEGAVWDVESLPPSTDGTNLRWRIDHFRAAEVSAGPVYQGLLLVSAVSDVPDVDDAVFAQAVLELELEARAIRVVRTRYADSSGRALRRIRPGRPGTFVAVGRGIIATDEDGSAVSIQTDAAGFDLIDVLHNEGSFPEYAMATSGGTWFTGSLGTSVSGLTLEPSLDVSRQASGHRLAALPGPEGPRIFGSTNLPAVLRREAAGWRRVNLWLPESSSACGAGVRVCGRGILGSGGAKELVALDDDRLAFSLVDCPGVLVFNPDRDECVGAALGPLSSWAEPATIGPNHIAAHEGRLLLSGEGGLLVELVIGSAD